MTTGVGLYVGDTHSVAVVTAAGSATRTIERATVLTPLPDGGVELGTRSEGSVEGFVTRAGEPGGIRYGKADARVEDLVATAMFCLFRDIAPELHGDVDVVAAHPSGWADESVAALRESLDYMGLQHAKLISAEDAVATSTQSYTTDAAHADEEVDSSVSESRTGWAAAHGGALVASGYPLARDGAGSGGAEFETDTFPPVSREMPTAYSQAVVLPVAEHVAEPDSSAPAAPLDDVDAPTAPTVAEAATDPPAADGRRPLVLAGAAAALLTLAGVAAALVAGYSGTTEVPAIRDAKQVESSDSPSPTRAVPIDFPTVAPEKLDSYEPTVQRPETTRPQPPVTSVPVAVPAPPPVAVTSVAPPTVTTTEPPATTDPTDEETTPPAETTTTDPTTTTETEPEPEESEDTDKPDPGNGDAAKDVASQDTL